MSDLNDLKESVLENLNWRSENATAAARNLALGVLVLVWGILALGEGNELLSSRLQHWLLIGSGVAAIICLSADWLQALIGYFNASKAFDRVNSPGFKSQDGAYPTDWTYNWTKAAFILKQVSAPLAAALLITCLLLSHHLWNSVNSTNNADPNGKQVPATAQSDLIDFR